MATDRLIITINLTAMEMMISEVGRRAFANTAHRDRVYLTLRQDNRRYFFMIVNLLSYSYVKIYFT